MWTRDLSEEPGTEFLARITTVEQDGWPRHFFFIPYLLAFDPPRTVAELAAAAGCTPADLLR